MELVAAGRARWKRENEDYAMPKTKSIVSSTVLGMPRGQLADFDGRLGGLTSCFPISEHDFVITPTCPPRNFKPAEEPSGAAAAAALQTLDDEMDQLVGSWTQTLLANLEDPLTKEALRLLKNEPHGLVGAFIERRASPVRLEEGFFHALEEALSGLTKVAITTDELRTAPLAGASPETLRAMKRRFEEYLDRAARGKETGRVRIVFEEKPRMDGLAVVCR